MSHLDQFSLDQFTSPWQVKRLCDVPTHSRALTSIPVESGHLEWSISDKSSQKDSVKSPTFCLDQLEFFFQMFFQAHGKMSINMCLEKSVEKETKMCLKMSILNKDGHKISTKDVFVKLTEVELEYDCAEFEINENDIQKDNQLKLFLEVNVLKEPSCTSVFVPPIPKVLPELNSLLTNRQVSDVVLHFTSGNQLHAHRSILSSRSPVFFGMFQHDTIEAQLGQVDITDVDMEVCELMLRYIYTGLVELDQTWTLDLMIAADKYELSELKIKCEDWLCTNQSIESVTECLVWSDQIGATKLKTKSIEFFHRNSIKISQEKTFNELIQNRPELLLLLYLDTTKHLNNQIDSNVIEELEEEEKGDISVL